MTNSTFSSEQNHASASVTTFAKASGLVSAFTALLLGLSTVFVVGHFQAATLHDAAHDVRHATGFPCH